MTKRNAGEADFFPANPPRPRPLMRPTAIPRPSSRAIFLFVSGQVGSRSDGPAPNRISEAQIRLAFSNLEATLAARGDARSDDIVDVTPYISQGRSRRVSSLPRDGGSKSDVFSLGPVSELDR